MNVIYRMAGEYSNILPYLILDVEMVVKPYFPSLY